MAKMKVSAPGMFAQVKTSLRQGDRSMADYYAFGLDEFMQHLRETVAGKHTLAEFAEHYCIKTAPKDTPHA